MLMLFSGLRVNPDRRVIYQDQQMIDEHQVWAPELHKIDGNWYFYYASSSFPYALSGGPNVSSVGMT